MIQAARVPRVAVALAGITAAAWFTIDSFNPQHYFRYAHRAPEPWSHPTSAVALIALGTLLEAAILYVVVDERRQSPTWIRALCGVLIVAPWSYWTTMFVVHAPGFILLHALWVWCILLVLVVIFLASGAIAVLRWRERVHEPTATAG